MDKILFLHIPKSVSKPSIMFIPLGTVALANFLKEKGHDSSIVNAYVEKQLDESFDPVKFVKEKGFKTICIPLHWHFQTYDALETARKIKKEVPDSTIILGGFTATYFADEILKEYGFVDFVVRGDAETPLLDLVEGKEHEKIPNLAWRNNKKITLNPLDYKIGQETLNKLNFTDFSLISHLKEYQRLGLPKTDKDNKWLFVYNPGIGCNTNCSYCGGSCSSQKRLNGREKALFVDVEKAVSELKNLAMHSMGVWCVTFDPVPKSDYYIKLFKRLRGEKISIRCKFEAWCLPTKEFVDEFEKTFVEGSEILLSPETGSEKVRKINKGFYFSNEEFLNILKYADDKGVRCRIYFTAGLPGEGMEEFKQTLILVNRIRTETKHAIAHAVPIEIEPASPMYMEREKYKVKSKRQSIRDFYNTHKKQSGIGYSTEHFSEEDIPELVNLLRAAGECRMKRPVFLKALTEAPFPFDKFPKKEIWRFCTICKFFNDCFA